jgi:hypothetical protein
VTRNEVDDGGRQQPEKPTPLLLLLVAAPVPGVVGLPNWLRGFDPVARSTRVSCGNIGRSRS